MSIAPAHFLRQRLWAVVFCTAIVAAGSPVTAHEFWLDAVKYTPKAGDVVPIVHRTGQKFLGDSYPYVKAWSKRYAVVDARGERPVKAIEGDDPASEITFKTTGLSIVVYQGTPDPLVFETMEKFDSYLDDEGLEWVKEKHRALKKPETKILEMFARCAKALIQVGAGGGGNDRAVGLPLELVAERNPYELGQGELLPVRLLHEGKPLAGALIKVFHLKDPELPRRYRTDVEGRAKVPLPFAGEYLLNAVHMLQVAPKDKADWSSLWASMTFARP
jgi:Domain of unknown function (DUF4198)